MCFTSAQTQFEFGGNVTSSIPYTVEKFTIADVNNDGNVDVIASIVYFTVETSPITNNSLVYYAGDGQGIFSEFVEITNDLPMVKQLVVSDLENDGDWDILYASGGFDAAPGIGYFKNDGSGNFNEEVILANSFDTYTAVIPVELNGDNHIDILCLRYLLDNIGGQDNSSISFFLSDGLGGFSNESEISVDSQGWTNSICSFDVDGDGDNDIVATRSNNSIVFLYNDGTGVFTLQTDRTIAYEFPEQVYSTDIDSDGDIDFLVDGLAFTLFLNDGSGIFSESVTIIENASIRSIEVFDIDGDSDKDIAVINVLPPNQWTVQFLLNKGQNNFTEAHSAYDASFDGELFASDVDGDGDSDLVTAVGSNSIEWFENMPQLPLARFEFSGCKSSVVNTSFAYFPHSSLNWDFGNGLSSEEINPELPYEALGAYNVSLEVCNSIGCDIFEETITVEYVAIHEIPINGVLNQELAFANSSLGYTNWSWIFGDGDVSLEKNPTHSYTDAGTYLVELFLTDSLTVGCTRKISQEIVIGNVTGVDDDNFNQIKISPNPSSDYCLIEAPSTSNWQYQLYDVSGSLLVKGSFEDKTFRLDTSGIQPGVYFLQLIGVNGITAKQKLIVLRD